MADHQELVSEMTILEKMSTQERLKLARKRRVQQLKKWSQREKEYSGKRKKDVGMRSKKSAAASGYKVHFVPSVMLLEAAARNDVDEVRRLLMLSVSPDSTNEDGLTALHQCCIDDSEEMMKLLIEFGANVNATDSEQWTPLHAAATCGHLHLVKYLIAKGADLLAVNADGNMPYDICEDEATLDYIESEMAKRGITQDMIDETRASIERQMLLDLRLLNESSEDLESRDMMGATPLHIASANGYLSVVEFLLDNHVSTDVVDNDLWQPVHAAACWGHPDVLELLVQAGGDLNAKTKNGETPLDICEDPELKERIIQLKSEMETKRANSHSQKLKRSHSANTRTQSVRRTSIREKSQISRREAKEEGRIRHEKELAAKRAAEDDDETRVPPVNQKKDLSQNFIDTNGVELILDADAKSSPTKGPSDDMSLMASGQDEKESKAEPTVIRNSGFCEKDMSSASSDSGAALQRNSSDSVKVEIHVTVNTSSPAYGTLSDLKKHRSDQRRGSDKSSGGGCAESSSPENTSGGDVKNSCQEVVTSSSHSTNNNSHMIRATYLLSDSTPVPPSPSMALKKFRGPPGEVVGGDAQKRGCCCIT